MRVIKEAEERRTEILNTAEELFTVKGYVQTTITDILNTVGIAKGTFYYYFKSKEEVMDAIVKRMIDNEAAQAKQIASDTSKTPTEKIFAILLGQKPKKDDVKNKLLDEFHKPSNAEMHQKSLSLSIISLSPIMAQVVCQGIECGDFSTQYPQEVIELLMASGQVLFDPAVFTWTPEETICRMNAFIDLMEKSLGAKEGSFSFMTEILNQNGNEKGSSNE